MGDMHKGAGSLDRRFAGFVERFIRPRLPVLVAAVSAFLVADWYTNHWADVYMRAQRTMKGNADPDVIMGLLAAAVFVLGFATSVLIRLIPRGEA